LNPDNNDLLDHKFKSFLVWVLPALAIIGSTFWSSLAVSIIWPLSFGVMGVFCLINVKRCGRTHCLITGPFFLIMAITSIVLTFIPNAFGSESWSLFKKIALFGSLLLLCLPDMLLGKYFWKK
jgi:hypothetical protein